MDQPKTNRSLLWPILLIGVGIIWLLGNLGFIPAANFATLLSLWPLLLIVIGLDMLIGRRSTVASAIIGLLVVAAVIFFLLTAPAFNLPASGAIQSQIIVEPLGEASAAEVELHLSSLPARLYALEDSRDLMRAEIDYFGSLYYSASGDATRRISLRHISGNAPMHIPFNPTARWDIGLSPAVPIDLSIDGSSGSAEINLTGLAISSLWFDQGSGSFKVILPMNPNEYIVTAIGGSGSLEIDLPEQTSLILHLDGQSGSIRMRLPDNAGVRLEVLDSGSGSVNFPSSLELVSGGEDKEGIWQSPGYESAVYKIEIICDDLGSGSFSLR